MSTQTRIGMALAGIVILIAAAALINGIAGDDDQPQQGNGATAATAATGASGATEPTGQPKSRRVDPGPLLEPGSVTTVKADKGETVRFRVRSGEVDELHVHGYDRTVELPAGETVKVKFKATLDGVFEIELHHTGEQIGELRVTP
ncbi:MAG: hypothetical protein HZB14_01895 [Actinobacteria bacterium]|nr:hypothetical protein [Actinomycetota bacterium]